MTSDRDRIRALETEIRLLRALLCHLADRTMGSRWTAATLAALAAAQGLIDPDKNLS